MMILIYATTVATGRVISGSTVQQQMQLPTRSSPDGREAITRIRLAATSSSCLALLVI